MSEKDILDIASKVNGARFDRFEKLNSRMTFESLVSERHGRDFSWWEETYQIGWGVLTKEVVEIDPGYNYSKGEIKNLVKEGKIISLGRYADAVGFDPVLPYEKEEPEKIDIPEIKLDYKDVDVEDLTDYYTISFDFDCLQDGDTEFGKRAKSCAYSMLRRRLYKKKVLKSVV